MKIWYLSSNNGDGSRSVFLSRKEFDTDRMEEEDPETWYDAGCHFIEITGDNVVVTGLDDDLDEDDGFFFFEEQDA